MDYEAEARTLAKVLGITLRLHKPTVTSPASWITVTYPSIGKIRLNDWEKVYEQLRVYAKRWEKGE